jgi:translation initiation factor 4G
VGAGETDAEKAVQRRSIAAFLSCRMDYLDAPENDAWSPHDKCLWKDGKSATRVDQIDEQMQTMWHFKPLEVNDETRWKSRSLQEGGVVEEDTTEEKIRKATGIMNKLSWTTLDKLTVRFLESLGGGTENGEAFLSKEIVEQSMVLVVDKAMMEPHFAELYASLCSKLAAVHKSFKKTLLALCQTHFEESDREESLDTIPDNPAERQYQLAQLKKKYIGLMQFIGELYKNKVIKGAIMISCLDRLFKHTDEEKIECFAKLMTTIGERLHAHEDEPEMHSLWDQVYSMAGRKPRKGKGMKDGPTAPSARIKFLLQDLIELKESGWVHRRPTEKARKISEIHNEVLEEEAAAARGGGRRPSKSQMNRSQSGGVLQQRSSFSSQQYASSSSLASQSSSAPPPPDSEGFTAVGKAKKAGLRRVQSEGGAPASSLQRAMATGSKPSRPNAAAPGPKSPKLQEYLDPAECGKKMKSLLKEYFVGGDMADAVLSVDELIGKGHEADVERGSAMVEAGVFMVMEGKQAEVENMLKLFEGAADKIPPASFVGGLKGPVGFLRDVEIDAPLAPNLLAMIMADWFGKSFLPSMDEFWVKNKDLEDFRERAEETRAAEFLRQVIRQRGGDLTVDDIEAVTQLMTNEERLAHPEVRSWIEESP